MTYSVRNQLIRTADGKVKFKVFRPGGKEHYQVGLWVDGGAEALDAIESVIYRLHPSFVRPRRSSSDRKNKFSMTIWTWGMFDVDVEIGLRDGSTRTLKHFLSYELPEDGPDNYAQA